MKKLLIATNLFFIAIICWLAFDSHKIKMLGAAALPGPTTDSCIPNNKYNYKSPQYNGEIDARLAERMSQDYSTDHNKGYMYNGSLFAKQKEDAWCIWFELGKIKNLISLMENSVCQKGCDHPLNLGIRLYYAKYPARTGRADAPEDIRNLPLNYAGRHTAFMVATYDNEGGKHIDFDPLNVGINKCKPISYKELLQNTAFNSKIVGVNAVLHNNLYFSDTTVNHGDLMPPPDGQGVFPTGN